MYCPTENDALYTAKRRDSFRKPSEMKTQPELRVADCGCARNPIHSIL